MLDDKIDENLSTNPIINSFEEKSPLVEDKKFEEKKEEIELNILENKIPFVEDNSNLSFEPQQDNVRTSEADLNDIKAKTPKKETSEPIDISYINISHAENNILNDIEKENNSDDVSSRDRSNSLIKDNIGITVRSRKKTLDSFENIRAFDLEAEPKFQFIFDYFELLLPKVKKRIRYYVYILFFLIFMISTAYFTSPFLWMQIYLIVISLDAGFTIADNLFFSLVVDKLFSKHYDIAYMLRGFNGPIGMLATAIVIRIPLRWLPALNEFPNWDSFISAVTTIIICISFKNWLTRKHYVGLLEKRFSEKLFKLETWTILLSELATTRPPKPRANSKEVNLVKKRLSSLHKKIINVFSDLVEATSKYNDDPEEEMDLANLVIQNSQNKSTSDHMMETSSFNEEDSSETNKHNIEDSGEIIKLKEQLRRRKTFWESAARLSANSGTLRIMTYDGPVFIRKRSQAKDFGRKLYIHLSRGGKVKVTKDLIEKLLNETNSLEKEDLEDSHRNNIYSAIRMSSQVLEADNSTLLLNAAKELFDPFNVNVITEEQCIAALINVYKEERFAASSLNDFGELHESLRAVIDFFFWVIMWILLQAFMNFNIFTFILPFITLAITLSFAISTLVGNLFVSIVYVFFMLPYDIGNKIMVGSDPNNPTIIGYVKGVNLLYTTINCVRGELMRLPNHNLFFQNVINYTESSGMVLQVNLSFNIHGDYNSDQKKINEYIEKAKNFVLKENKVDWQDIFIWCNSIDTTNNSLNYIMWLTHRDNWHDITRPYNARTKFLCYLKRLQIKMGLKFVQITLPVSVNQTDIKVQSNN